MTTISRFSVLLALGAVLLAGCGGGAKKAPDARARYTAQAERICQGAETQTNALITKLSAGAIAFAQGKLTPAQARALAPTARRLQSTAAGLLARLRALSPPPGDQAKIQQFLGPTAALLGSISAAAGALTLGDAATAATSLQQALAQGQSAQTAATAYGLKQCAVAVLPSGL